MNCFEWQNKVCDLLDGTLIGTAKKEADEHLDSCATCNTRYQHYQQIRFVISNLPRSTLPVPIRKSPLSIHFQKEDFFSHKTGWAKTPWYIRTSVEGLGIAFIVLFVVAMVPRVRTLYEKSIEHRPNQLDISDFKLSAESDAPEVPLNRGKPQAQADPNPEEEFLSEGDHPVLEETPSSTVNSEIWRFTLKTDSPRETRAQIIQILNHLRIPSTTPGLGGLEAPGGIQFDLLLPQGVIPELKRQLQKISATGATPDTPGMGETFTWYKNKSRRPSAPGKSRVVIWLSQI